MRSALAAIAVLLLSLAGTVACIALITLTPYARIPIGLRLEDVARFLPMQMSFTVVGDDRATVSAGSCRWVRCSRRRSYSPPATR